MQFLRLKYRFTLFAAIVAMTFAPSCWAHAKLQNSNPAANVVLTEPPKNVRLEFNEKLEKTFSVMTVSTVQGQTVSTEKVAFDAFNPKVMTLTLPPLVPGQYQVDWSAVTVDGHRVKGHYQFTVQK